MPEMQVFNFKGHAVRTVIKDGEPWFALDDVCGVLEIADTRNVTSHLDDDDMAIHSYDTPSGVECNTIINAYGLYSITMSSKNLEARAFRYWIANTVVPSIRKHIARTTNDFLTDPREWAAKFTALAEKREEIAHASKHEVCTKNRMMAKDEVSEMNTGLQVFQSEQFGQVRTVVIDAEPWFVAADVCRSVGIENTGNAVARLHKDDIRLADTIDKLGRKQQVNVINESGLYSLILRSDKPNAREFQLWVTREILPSIRKTGMYATDELLSDPDLFIKALQQLKEERAAKVATQKLLDEKTLLLDEKTQQLDESKEWITIKRMAKLNNIDWQAISWKRLKNTSNAMELPVKKIFDANYGNVNIYHIDVWRHEYAHLVPAYEAA